MKYSIITIHHIHNFGSVFQAYSLYRFLTLNGYDAEIVDYRPDYYKHGRNKLKTVIGQMMNLRSYTVRKRKFENFIVQYDKLSEKRFTTTDELRDYYHKKDNCFIAGGDQLWNNYHPCGNDAAYKLTFTDSAKKLAYGTSMGRDNFSDDELKSIADEIKDFNKIMLREQSTVHLLKNYTDIPISHVIDPVGLIDIGEFEKIAVKPEINEPYAVMYLADSGELLDKTIDVLSKKLGLKIVHICGFRKKCYCDYFEKDVGPEEILGYILHADFVLSASFHATMFSLLFNKQFATLLPGTQTNARISDILQYVGLENRMIRSVEDLEQIEKTIDYTKANTIIEEFKQKSKSGLLETLYELSGKSL
ncbi:MAG: polysaccharide pyruvyl transferase family protein [Oscillospiraceae bacterium]|nr:polysaccharide pyruvyl transferase family protein [Oscillospiraceae bacterium]